ncbi:hypothetical protein JAAARDRAFT_221860 [Jaapia argillacea MUCL 33604]|uniref:Spo12-like protein n=1 Tax=Jaapia argillacea MUCL 33604 TaxID=933084 RepID=A0A067QBD3_9AGAM|nr:hypothetical protein JAAARDRAFT_221860 [Jaapia argillacea MUCL 33604]
MSTTSTPNDSPVHIQSLHNPSQAARVAVPQAPLGNATNGATFPAPGMGTKALLAKRIAKQANPTFISPTDNLMTPCTQKITQAKKKHFTKGAAPMGQLFGNKDATVEEDDDEPAQLPSGTQQSEDKMDEDENPF